MDERAARMARRFEVPVLMAALLVIPVIVIEESEPGAPWSTIAAVANWLIWLVFAAELVAMVMVVPSRKAWLRRHPLEVAVVVLTPPFAPASLQAARAFRLVRLIRLAAAVKVFRGFFTMAGLRYATLIAAFGILAGGAAFAAVEKDQDLTAWDGVYWAITTITTVGYGDIGPETEAGRIIAITVMLTGIGYVAILTAAVAQQFLATLVGGEQKHEAVVIARLEALDARLARIESGLGEAIDGDGTQGASGAPLR
jgi:voltage-gated potassium channel